MTEDGLTHVAANPGSGAKSGDRALAVLQLLAQAGRRLASQEIASGCGIPKSSAHSLLNVMKARGFVAYDPLERTWGLGPAVIEVAAAYGRSDPLQREGRVVLRDLNLRLGHTAHLAVLRGSEVLYTDKVDAHGTGVRLVTEVGARLPAHLTSVGQAILAHMPTTDVEQLYDGHTWVDRTGQGPQDLAALLGQLDQVRRRGAAHDVGMISSGISCVASAVLDRHGEPIAAVGVTFVTAQVQEEELKTLFVHVRAAASHLSLLLGSQQSIEA